MAPTAFGCWSIAISCTSSVIWASPRPAFLRIGIGVEPVWLSLPVTVHSIQRRPWPWVTTPISTLLRFEDRPLLDMQLEEGVHFSSTDLFFAAPADPLQFIAECSCSVGIDGIVGPVLRVTAPANTPDAKHRRRVPRALLIGPVGHHDRVLGLDAQLIERADDFQSAKHAQDAVIFAAGRLGIEMRADIDWKRIRVRAFTAREHVAHLIEAHAQPFGLAPFLEKGAALGVVIGQRLAVVAAGYARDRSWPSP